MRGRIAVLAFIFGVLGPALAAASEGILLLAHNGTPEWTARVKELAAKVDSQKPIEVVFGIGPSSIAPAVSRLASRGVTQVVAVPFFYPTISPEDLAGHALPVRIGAALVADPVFADVVRSRADEISAGGGEMLVVVGYGSEDGGKPWKLDLDPIAQRLNGTRRFASVLTIGRPAERIEAEQRHVRVTIERQVTAGRSILVVPILGADGERDPALEPMLQGFSYRIAKAAVITDDRVVDWLAKQATPLPR